MVCMCYACDQMVLKRQDGEARITLKGVETCTLARNQQVLTEDTAVFKSKHHRGLSEVIEVTEISSQDQNLQRRVKQILGDTMHEPIFTYF